MASSSVRRRSGGTVHDDTGVPTPERLSEVLLTPEEAARLDAPGTKEAGVLVPLYPSDDGLVAVLTERRGDLSRHAGEISFPGGRQDHEREDLRDTALREAEEEIGLPAAAVRLVGALPPVGTFVTSYRIHPFVGVIEPGLRWTPQESEVERVLELSLADLRRGHEMKRLLRRGVPVRTPTYTVGDHFVWGATARIVQSLLARLEPLGV
jgi:8-oxo-dGTP pyrophosphatase MutT (NUDIX family)